MFDDLIGSFFGWSAGSAIRQRRLRKKAARIRRGEDFAVWVRSHTPGAPDWKTPRGSLRRRAGQVGLRPLIRRWRRIDLTDARSIGSQLRRSAADGDALVLELRPGLQVDQLLIPSEIAPHVEPLFGSAYEVGAHRTIG